MEQTIGIQVFVDIRPMHPGQYGHAAALLYRGLRNRIVTADWGTCLKIQAGEFGQ
ncbi:MAG: hypothetical protein K9L59_15580 [Desulfobacterales bacterium]|nr:hypothetical protein [Desulfobacterales bacterium]